MAITHAHAYPVRVINLDNPTNHLSAGNINTVLGRGMTTIDITHNMDSVFSCSDRSVAMVLGHVVQDTWIKDTTIDAVHTGLSPD